VPIGAQRLLYRFQRPCIYLGEGTTRGWERRYGCCGHAPHRSMVIVRVERLDGSKENIEQLGLGPEYHYYGLSIVSYPQNYTKMSSLVVLDNTQIKFFNYVNDTYRASFIVGIVSLIDITSF